MTALAVERPRVSAGEATAAASCSWCGLVVWSRAGDASGPVVRLLEHWRDAHPGGVPAAMVSEAAWGWRG